MKISIITASYNYEKYLTQAIESVLAQTLQDWELIIVDDGSQDNSVESIKKYCEKDSRIKLFQHENAQNLGLCATLLKGIENATGEWIAFLESDDWLNPEYLEKKIKIINDYPDIKLIFNKIEFIQELSSNTSQKIRLENRQNWLKSKSYPRNMSYDFYFTNKILTFSSVMAKRNDLLQLDFNTPEKTSLDWWLWIQMAQKGSFYYIKEPLTYWRQHPQSQIAKTEPKKHNLPRKAYWKLFMDSKSIKTLMFLCLSAIIGAFRAPIISCWQKLRRF